MTYEGRPLVKYSYAFVLFLLVLLVGCATEKVVVANRFHEQISIQYNNQYMGIVQPNGTLVFSPSGTYDSGTNTMLATGKQVEGKIVFTSMRGNGAGSLPGNRSMIYNVIDSVNATYAGSGYDHQYSDKQFSHFFEFLPTEMKQDTLPVQVDFGYVKLTSNEQDVSIYVDNEFVGKIADGALNKKLPVGLHRIMAKKPFYRPITIKVTIEKDRVFSHVFQLLKAEGWSEPDVEGSTAQQARGDLSIVTERNDYKVYIEGVLKSPPFELRKMPAGVYDIRVVNITLGVDDTLRVTVDEDDVTLKDLDAIYGQ